MKESGAETGRRMKETERLLEDGAAGAEFDILLENGESIVGVEVKAKPKERDIEDHIGRLAFYGNTRTSWAISAKIYTGRWPGR